MKRDMNLIVEILLNIDSCVSEFPFLPVIDNYAETDIAYHCFLLVKIGFVEGIDISTNSNLGCYVTNLTKKGEEFLAPFKEDNKLAEISTYLSLHGMNISSVPSEILLSVAKSI